MRTATGIHGHAQGLGMCLLTGKTLREEPHNGAKLATEHPHAGGLGRVRGTMSLREVTSLGWLNEGDEPMSR